MRYIVFIFILMAIYVTTARAEVAQPILTQKLHVDSRTAVVSYVGLVASGSITVNLAEFGQAKIECAYGITDGHTINLSSKIIGLKNIISASVPTATECTNMITELATDLSHGAKTITFTIMNDGDAVVVAD